MKRFIYLLLIFFITSNSSYALFNSKPVQSEFKQAAEFQNISNQANVYYAGNDIKNAFNLLISIPEDERTPQNWLLLGNILQDQGKNNEAVFMYNRAIQEDGNYYKAYYNLGNIYLAEDKVNMAIEQYKKVIKIKPEYAYAHYNLACAYIKQEQYKKARFELLTAIDLKNTVADFYYNLAYVYKKLKNEKNAKIYMEYYNKLKESQI